MRSLLTTASLFAMTFGASALAQDETPVAERIVVTAQKVEEAQIEVPINLTAFDTETLDRLGIEQFDDLSDFVPGLEIQEQSPNNPGFVIRGITSDSGEATTEPRVAVFQDGVPLSRSRGSYVELFDLERIEVAKGPQATLFGRGALIGGINLIQAKPEDSFGARVTGGFGDDNYRKLEAMITGPILGDALTGRLAMIDKSRDGFIENALGGEDFNSVDVQAWRGSLTFAPNDDIRFDLIANWQSDRPAGTSFKSGTFPPPGGDTSPFTAAALNTFGGFEGGKELGLDREVWGLTLLTSLELNDYASLSLISGFRQFDSFETFDPDGYAGEVLVAGEDAEGDQFSQEIRLNFDNGDKISGFVGAAYFNENGGQRIPFATNEAFAQAFLAPILAGAAGLSVAQVEGFLAGAGVPGAANFDNPVTPLTFNALAALQGFGLVPLNPFYVEETANFGETRALDVFGDVSIEVTDKLTLTGGLRLTDENKVAQGYGRNVSGPNSLTGGETLFIPATPNGELVSKEESFQSATWRLVAAYRWSDALNTWATYGRGRRPEVIALDTSSPDFFNVLPAELVDSYELGAFFEPAGGNIRLSGSLYYSEYENFQTSRFEPGTATFVQDNAGLATQYGFEGEAYWTAAEGVDLFATYGYNFAEFDDTDGSGNAQELAGNTFRLNPEHALAVGANLERPFSFGRVYLRPSYVWQSKVFFDNDNDTTDAIQDEFQDSYGLVKLRLGVAALDDRWDVRLFVDNALDEEYIIDAGNTGDAFGIPTFIAGPPRLAGVELTGRF